jgi:hypothetical protein
MKTESGLIDSGLLANLWIATNRYCLGWQTSSQSNIDIVIDTWQANAVGKFDAIFAICVYS